MTGLGRCRMGQIRDCFACPRRVGIDQRIRIKVKALKFPLFPLLGWLALLSSCATVDYTPPGQGTSAELPSILAKTLEENMKDIPFDPAGKKVHLQIHAWGSYQNSLGLERYVESLFREWILDKGGEIGPGQFQMAIYLPLLGNRAVGREMSYQYIPIYYSERFQAMARFIVGIRDAEGKTARVWQKGEGACFSDIYLMRIFGPFDVPRQK